MIIGEGPADADVSKARPFVGADGRLLDAIIEDAGFTRAECWVTNVTLGRPPRGQRLKGNAFRDLWRDAAYSCIPRLEAELEEARPGVIVTLGPMALEIATSYEVRKTKLQPFVCPEPDCVDVKGKPRSYATKGLACAVGDCEWFELCPDTDDELVKSWREIMLRELDGACPSCGASIKRLRPKRITCRACGGKRKRSVEILSYASEWKLSGRDGVVGAVFNPTTLAGRWDEFGVRYIMPTYHPNLCLRGGKDGRGGGQYAARVISEHLRKAHDLLSRPVRWKSDVELVSDPERLCAAFASVAGSDVTTDVETNSREGAWACTTINCIGFGHRDWETSLVVDTRRWTVDTTQSALMDEVQRFLENEQQPKVLHNGAFDRVVVSRLWGVDMAGVTGDTLIEHNACYPDEEHGLGFVTHELTDAPPWKDRVSRKSWGRAGDKDELGGYDSFAELVAYNANDVRATALAHSVLTKKGGRLDQAKTRQVAQLDMAMADVAVGMELAGVHVNVERLREIEDAHVRVCAEELHGMRELVGREDWVPRGGALLWALFDDAGPLQLEPYGYTKTGQPSMDKPTLLKMVDAHPLIPKLLRWRKYEYALTHYIRGKGMVLDEWDYIHPTWKVYGARTGRWSSSPNFQNWTTGDYEDEATNMKSAVAPPPGRAFVGADYSQLELRIMAGLSNDANLIRRCLEADESDKLNPERDPHSHVASLTFGATFANAEKKRRKALRDVAKRVFYGLGYGAGEATVLASIYDGGYEGPPLNTRIIRATMDAIFAEFPGIERWRNTSVDRAMETREIRSPILGRRRIFPLGDIDATVCYNFPIQSCGADIMNTRLAVLAKALEDYPSADLFAQVHDAVYVECDEAVAPKVERLVEDCLTTELALVEGGQPMPFTAFAHTAYRWDQAA